MCLFLFCLFHNSTTATSGQYWHWTGANAIDNVAYSEDVQVPEFVWRWFNTGDEIPKDYWLWAKGEPQQGFDEVYQTYAGCAATTAPENAGAGWFLKTFNCRTLLPYICQELKEA
jgi:hypothetical protein